MGVMVAAVVPSQSPIQRKGTIPNPGHSLLFSSVLRLIPQIRFPSGSLKEWEALLFVKAYCGDRLRMKPGDGSDK